MIATNHSRGSFQSCTCRLGYVEYFVGIRIKMTCCWIGWQWCSWGCLLLFHFVLVIVSREGISSETIVPIDCPGRTDLSETNLHWCLLRESCEEYGDSPITSKSRWRAISRQPDLFSKQSEGWPIGARTMFKSIRWSQEGTEPTVLCHGHGASKCCASHVPTSLRIGLIGLTIHSEANGHCCFEFRWCHLGSHQVDYLVS